MSAPNTGQWRIGFWQHLENSPATGQYLNRVMTDDPGTCLTAPPEGLGVPAFDTQDTANVQRDGVEMYRDTYQPRQVAFSLMLTDASCPGGGQRQTMARWLRYWNRNCSSARLLIFADCTPETDSVPEDVSPFAEDRSLLGPYLLRGRPRQARVTHGRSNEGWTRLDLTFEADDHRIGVVQPDLLDGELAVETCLTVPVSGSASFDFFADIPDYPVITLYGPLTPDIAVDTGFWTVIYTEAISADERVVIDMRSARAVKIGTTTEDVTTLAETAGTSYLRPGLVPPGGEVTFSLDTGNGADAGYAEVCLGSYVVGI